MMSEQHFCFRDNRLFFNIASFQSVLGVKRAQAVNATVGYMDSLSKDQRMSNIIPLGCSMPAYLDLVAFTSVLADLSRIGENFDDENAAKVVKVLEMGFPVFPAMKSSLDNLMSSD